jgi:glutaconate CoA-transferase subunit A
LSKQITMREAIASIVADGASVAMGLQLEQMIPFAAAHEIIRQKKRDITLVGPIFDIFADQMIGAGCVIRVIAAWTGNVMMGSAYNFRREVESGRVKVTNMTNFTISLALQAAAMGVPFLPTKTAMGSDVAKGNEFFREIGNPFERGEIPTSAEGGQMWATEPCEKLHAIKALSPDVAIVHVQRADAEGNAHCWGSFGVVIEAVRAAKKVIVIAEEIVAPEVIASDPNRTVIPGFLVSAVVECGWGAHPSPVQGYYKRDDAYFRQYHEQTRTPQDFAKWAERWIDSREDRKDYMNLIGACRAESLEVKKHAYAAQTDYGY